MQRAVFFFFFLSFSKIISAQTEAQSLMKQALAALANTRTSYILDVASIRDSMNKAESLISNLPHNANVDKVFKNKYNAEYFYLKYQLEEISSSRNEDSVIKYLSYAILAVQRAYKNYDVAHEKFYGEINNLSWMSIQSLKADIRGNCSRYALDTLFTELGYSDETSLPKFPDEVPAYSAKDILPDFLLRKKSGITTLADVDISLSRALDACGYTSRNYFSYKNGFALATDMEQINEDGSSAADPERWKFSTGVNGNFSLWNYLQKLFTAIPAYYRVMVFIVSKDVIKKNDIVFSIAMEREGGDRLPNRIGDHEFTNEYKCTVFIYEFKRSDVLNKTVKLVFDNGLNGRIHLQKSNLLNVLK